MTPADHALSAKDVPSPFVRQTLLDRELVQAVERPVIRLIPWLHVVALGGRSILDRGGDAIVPVVDELRAAMADRRLLVLTGAGIRARHVLGVGLDLGLPTGVLAGLMSSEAEQNGHMLAALMAADGVSYLSHESIGHQLAVHLAACSAAIANAYPPYRLYELPPAEGKIPPHGPDAGTVLLADAYGAARTILVKDVDGICTCDPHGDGGDKAELIARVSVDELAAMHLPTLPIDRVVLEIMATAKHVKEIQIVNGRTPGNIAKALAGERVGTILHAG